MVEVGRINDAAVAQYDTDLGLDHRQLVKQRKVRVCLSIHHRQGQGQIGLISQQVGVNQRRHMSGFHPMIKDPLAGPGTDFHQDLGIAHPQTADLVQIGVACDTRLGQFRCKGLHDLKGAGGPAAGG